MRVYFFFVLFVCILSILFSFFPPCTVQLFAKKGSNMNTEYSCTCYWLLPYLVRKKRHHRTLVIRRQYEFMLIVAICPVKRVCRRSACVARLPPAGQTKFTQFSYLVTKVRFYHARIVVTFINLCDFAKITQFQTRFNIFFLPSSLGL